MKINKEKIKTFLKVLAIVLTIAVLLIFWPRTYCGRCGHIVEPGLSVVCSHCGNLLTDSSYIYCWWWFNKPLVKNDTIQNSNDYDTED